VVERARRAWHDGTPDSFKATLSIVVWVLAGIVLVLS
jgi:hypothetical protein